MANLKFNPFNVLPGEIVEFRLLNNNKINALVYSSIMREDINTKGKFSLLHIDYEKRFYIVMSCINSQLLMLRFRDGIRIEKPCSYTVRRVKLVKSK
jgi:hypothetical protein